MGEEPRDEEGCLLVAIGWAGHLDPAMPEVHSIPELPDSAS